VLNNTSRVKGESAGISAAIWRRPSSPPTMARLPLHPIPGRPQQADQAPRILGRLGRLQGPFEEVIL
jgi:hypothetical protein